VDDRIAVVDGDQPDSGIVVDGRWIIAIRGQGVTEQRGPCPPPCGGNSPPEVGDVHNHPRLSTESTPVIHTNAGFLGRGIPLARR
jgi:hypothetical protein